MTVEFKFSMDDKVKVLLGPKDSTSLYGIVKFAMIESGMKKSYFVSLTNGNENWYEEKFLELA